MILYFLIAALAIVSNVGALVAERSTNETVKRRLRFWCQIGAGVLTVSLVVFGLVVQRTAQQASSTRLANKQEELLNKQQELLTKQQAASNDSAQQQKEALERLDRSLKHSEDLEKKQEEQTAALEQQQDTLRGVLVRQSGEIALLNRLPLNRNLLGIEISYTPSPEKWDTIAKAFSKIKSPEPDLPYADAPMIAENMGEHWAIDFEPTQVRGEDIRLPNGQRMRIGGNKKLPKVSTKENQQFEEVLRQALFGLKIVWGNGTDTVLDPEQKYYPSAMYVSRPLIKFILRPPLMLWSVNEIDENPIAIFFGKDYPLDLPANFTIRSLDPGLFLDQNIKLNWVTRIISDPPTYDQQMYRKFSGPYDLAAYFAEFDPASGKRKFRRANKPK